MKNRLLIIKFVCLITATVFIASFSPLCAAEPLNQPEPLSKARLAAISAVSAFSPGIALLIITHQVKKERNSGGENNWLLDFLWLIWIVAFLDFILDMVPGVSQVNQFFEYGIIWYIAYVAATCFNTDFPMLVGALLGSGIQAGRHFYSTGLDTASSGTASPIRSTIENIVTAVSVYLLS